MTGQGFTTGTPFSSNDKTYRHDITEILLKVTLNTITLTPEVKVNMKFKEFIFLVILIVLVFQITQVCTQIYRIPIFITYFVAIC